MENLSEEQNDAILAYIFNRMTEAQQVEFEAELEQNPSLRKEVDHQRTIQRGMQLLAYKREAADMLKRINVSMDDDVPSGSESMPAPANDLDRPILMKPLWGRPMAWVAAASVVLLMGVFLYLLQRPTLPDSNTPVAQTDRPKPPVNNRPPADSIRTSTPVDSSSTVPVDPANSDHLLVDAFFRDPPKKAPVFIPGPDTDAAAPDDSAAVATDSANVLQGISLLKRRRDQEAASTLQQIVLEGYPGHWRATAEWYLSLAYLRINKPREARAILSRIARTKGHPYEAEARRLKKEMM